MSTYSVTQSVQLLVVDNDTSPRSPLCDALGASGHRWTRMPSTGLRADLVSSERCDVVLLDVGAHRRNVLAVISELRAASTVPIIAMGESRSGHDVNRALRMGADDYLVKPVRPVEMLVRIDVVLRSAQRKPAKAGVVCTGDAVVDLDARSVLQHGVAVELTRTEFDILELLCRSRSQVVSRNAITTSIWGTHTASVSKSLDVHVARLRAKLAESVTLRTVRGLGYLLD